MTTCDQMDLIAYLEGYDPQGRVARHVKGCPHCRNLLGQYRLLLQGMIDSRPACPYTPATLAAALGDAEPDRRHLTACVLCRGLFETVCESVADLGKKTAAETAPLPPAVKERITRQRRTWLKGRLRRVLDFQGIRDRKQRQATIRRMLETLDHEDRQWLKAAFPEDLAREDPEDEA